MNTNEVWAYSDQEDPDHWNGGYASKEEAISDAVADYGAGTPIWLQRGKKVPIQDLLPKAGDLVELVAERIFDYSHDAAEALDVTDEAKKELDAFLLAWVTKYIDIGSWVADQSFKLCPIGAKILADVVGGVHVTLPNDLRHGPTTTKETPAK